MQTPETTASRPGERDARMAPLAGSSTALAWQVPVAPPFRLSGLPWFAQDRVFRRLPLHPPEPVRKEVDELADCPAGAQLAFQSDTAHVAIRVELAGPPYMNHMAATGQCGFDLYLGGPGQQRFLHTARWYGNQEARYEVELFAHPDSSWRTFTLNFPLYQGVRMLHLGLSPGAGLRPPPAWADPRPVVVYGTSITQGGCASRPGLAYTNILSRALNREVVNLGFSGNGWGDPEVIRLAAAIPDPALLVLDYEANGVSFEKYRASLPEAIRLLRAVHADVPLLVVSRIAFARDFSHAEELQGRQRQLLMQEDVVATRRRAGDANLHFCNGSGLLGDDADECTVDGIHPNDLGFMRMARGLESVIRPLLKPSRLEGDAP